MATVEYEVSGMTCGHCAAAVKSEVEAIAGVTAVEVELEGGRLAITGAAAPNAEQVRAAVEEAGYELVG